MPEKVVTLELPNEDSMQSEQIMPNDGVKATDQHHRQGSNADSRERAPDPEQSDETSVGSNEVDEDETYFLDQGDVNDYLESIRLWIREFRDTMLALGLYDEEDDTAVYSDDGSEEESGIEGKVLSSELSEAYEGTLVSTSGDRSLATGDTNAEGSAVQEN